MCVAHGAKENIAARRRDLFLNHSIGAMLAEAKTLGIGLEELLEEIRKRKEKQSD